MLGHGVHALPHARVVLALLRSFDAAALAADRPLRYASGVDICASAAAEAPLERGTERPFMEGGPSTLQKLVKMERLAGDENTTAGWHAPHPDEDTGNDPADGGQRPLISRAFCPF